MTKIKRTLFTLVIGGIGGVLLSNFLLPILVKNNFARSGSLLGYFSSPITVVNKIEKETVVVPEADYFGDAIYKASSTILAVESFSGSRVARFGSGIVLTQDGLILTLNSIIPSWANYYQIWLNDNPQRGDVVYRDASRNLAIVKIDAAGVPVASFDDNVPDLASALLLVGKTVAFNKTDLLIDQAFVTMSGGDVFNFQSDYNEFLFGSSLINKSGQVLGIIDFKNKSSVLISGKIIKSALESYLEGEAR